MGDVASPQYPQPPQAQSQSTNLLSNPAQAIGLLNGVNQLKLFNAQYPALSQQPEAALQSTRMLQQESARQTIAAALGNAVSSIKNPTPDDVNSQVAYIARSYPQIATQYPDIISAAKDAILNNPKRDIQYGASMLRNSALSAGEGSSGVNVVEPHTGSTYRVPLTTANMAGATQSALPPGSDTSSQQMIADLQREGSYATDINPLNKALALAQKLGPGGMAPGSKGRQEFESFVYGLMPSLVPANVQGKIKDYAELEKYLAQNYASRANNQGPHTNEGLATTITGSPNVHINDLAGVDLIKAGIGVRNMEHAQVIQAAKAGGPGYANAKATFASQHDPRAYAINTMSPDEIKNLQTTLKGPERAKFNQSLRAAIDSGVVERP